MSVPPPAGKGTMVRMGLAGQVSDWLMAGVKGMLTSRANAMRREKLDVVKMVSVMTQNLWGDFREMFHSIQ